MRYRVKVRETYELTYEVDAESGPDARQQLQRLTPAFLGTLESNPDVPELLDEYRCISRTVRMGSHVSQNGD